MKLRNLTLTAAALAMGCGSSQADIYLFDAAPAGVKGVTVQVKSIDVHVDSDFGKTDSVPAEDESIDQDGKWQSQDVDPTTGSIDLMQHQGESAAAFLGTITLPEGKITQLRLVLDLSNPDLNYATFDDDSRCDLDTTAVAQNGIKINHVFKVVSTGAGDEEQVYLHFDLDNSLVASGSCFKLTPVLQLRKVVKNGKPAQI